VSVKIEFPTRIDPAPIGGFTAFGTARSTRKAERIRGVIIGRSGAVYAGIPQPVLGTVTWGLAFYNPEIPDPMVSDRYVLYIFDYRRPFEILARVAFTVGAEEGMLVPFSISSPGDGGTVARNFYASGSTTASSVTGSMTDSLGGVTNGAGHVFPNGSWNLGFSIAENPLHNKFTLDVDDPDLETSHNITVTN
jgi:hypothetical protein